MTGDDSFAALVVRKGADKAFTMAVEPRAISDLPAGDVLIRVEFSTINFKDCMSAHGHPAITRRYPHTPGIDAAGRVVESHSDQFRPGDRVAVISYAMGMSLPGGFGQYVRVPAAWVMPLPATLSAEEAMAFGTPGYTAALAVEAALASGIDPQGASAVVTGATGGVGALSVAFLAHLGVEVTAVSGKAAEADDFLKGIGAAKVLARRDFDDHSGRNLLLPAFDIAIDIAGGTVLATVIRVMKDNGVVIATGMADNTGFTTNVLPFILRGVRLIGINAENTPMNRRQALWSKMAGDWKPAAFPRLYQRVTLADLPAAIEMVGAGRQQGRVVVDLG